MWLYDMHIIESFYHRDQIFILVLGISRKMDIINWGISKKNSIEIQKNGFRVVILFLSVTNQRNGRRQSSNAVLNFRCKLNAPAGLFSPPPTTTVRYWENSVWESEDCSSRSVFCSVVQLKNSVIFRLPSDILILQKICSI